MSKTTNKFAPEVRERGVRMVIDHERDYANDHHALWYGRAAIDLVGLHMREFLGPDAYDMRREHLDRVAAGEQVSFEASVPYLDGTARDAAIRYRKLSSHMINAASPPRGA